MTSVLPEKLRKFIGKEEKEFVVYSKRDKPISTFLSSLGFGLFWTIFSLVVGSGFFIDLFIYGESNFSANGVPVTATWDNLTPLIMPGLIVGVFVLFGLIMIIYSLVGLLPRKAWFVGTPTRLIVLNHKGIRSIDWEQFSGDIQMKGNWDKGNLALGMRTGKVVSSSNSSHYIPKMLYMIGIEDVDKVEGICRKRIKENDPTPTKIAAM